MDKTSLPPAAPDRLHDERDGAAHNDLANRLREAGQFDDAVAHYHLALERQPESAAILTNLAGALEALGQYDRAEHAYRRAIDLQPDFDAARFNYSLFLLAAGRYAQAWPYYEARTRLFAEHQTLPFPKWRGEPLHGRSILLLPEQGYGDSIQFVRYASQVKALGASTVSVVSKPELAPLLRTVQGIDAVITDPRALSAHDCWASLLDLPQRFGTTPQSVPNRIPYVGVFRNRLDEWKTALPSGMRVGLVWKGEPGHANDRWRSIPHFSDLAPLWSVERVHFVSLQTGGAEAETDAHSTTQPVVCLGRRLRDFADTAAIVAQLNLVICVDTAIAHLAGALGIACWVMLPAIGVDWRWHRAGTGSPWYPQDFYLFRQDPRTGWAGSIHAVRDTLQKAIEERAT